MPIIRKQLKPSDVYPDDIRYNPSGDNVEVLIDGEWTPAPGSDPRRNNTLPPRVTSDTKCDAARSIADALQGQISGIVAAIDNASTAMTIVGIILSIFSFGVFAIFVTIALGIADYMIGLGSAAIEAALPPSAFDDLACILYCHMDEDGRISAADIPNIQQEMVDQLGATAGTIINSMIDLAGFAGLNGLAAVGTSTGDCSACGCPTTWCKFWDFTTNEGGWDAIAIGGGIFGTFVPGEWQGTDAVDTISSPDISHRGVALRRIFATRTVTHINIVYDLTKGTSDLAGGSNFRLVVGDIFSGTVLRNLAFSAMSNGTNLTQDWTGSQSMEELQMWLFSSRDQTIPYTYGGTVHIKAITMEGDGTNPFGADDCP